VAEISIFLVISNIFTFACCSPHWLAQNFWSLFHLGATASGQSQELIPVSKYKKDQADDTESSICLTDFMEGERKWGSCQDACTHSMHHVSICGFILIPLAPFVVVLLQGCHLQHCPRAHAAADVSRPCQPLFKESPNMHCVVFLLCKYFCKIVIGGWLIV